MTRSNKNLCHIYRYGALFDINVEHGSSILTSCLFFFPLFNDALLLVQQWKLMKEKCPRECENERCPKFVGPWKMGVKKVVMSFLLY